MTRKTTRQILAIGTLSGFIMLTIFLLLVSTAPKMAGEMWTAWLGLTTSVNMFYFMSEKDETTS